MKSFRLLPIILTILFLINCSKTEFKKGANENEIIDCENVKELGKVKICLPNIPGMNEAYNIPAVKKLADAFRYEGNTILGIYLNDATYEKSNFIDGKAFDDYAKVYIMTSWINNKFSLYDLNQLASKMRNNFDDTNWDDIKNKVNNNELFSIDKPIKIDSYSPHNNARTIITLMNYQTEINENAVIAVMNVLLIKRRAIFLGYFLNFNGEESINNAKQRNDSIVVQLINANN